MGKIYRTYNINSGRTYEFFTAEDDEKAQEILLGRRYSNSRMVKKGLDKLVSVEFVEEAEDVNRRLASYLWPQIDRIEYKDSCFEADIDKKFTKRINNAIDWLVETFPQNKNSFEIERAQDQLIVTVFESGKFVEMYKFCGKEPYERILKK